MRPPHVPERPVPVLEVDQIRALLAAVKGRGFLEVRDTALIRMPLDTGMRRSELTGLGHIHPHQFRHTFAHEWLSDDGHEGDLMRLAGWKAAPCSSATPPPPPTPEPARPTDAGPRGTATEPLVAVRPATVPRCSARTTTARRPDTRTAFTTPSRPVQALWAASSCTSRRRSWRP